MRSDKIKKGLERVPHRALLGSVKLVACVMFTLIIANNVYPADSAISDEEYKVYSGVLSSLSSLFKKSDTKNCIVIYSQTSIDKSNLDLNKEAGWQYLKTGFGDLFDKELIEHFLSINNVSYKLENKFSNTVSVILVEKRKLDEFFTPTGGWWKSFYDKFPASYGIIQLSKVAFNKDGDTALFYYGHIYDVLAGAGYLVLLKKGKESDAWNIVKQVMLWES